MTTDSESIDVFGHAVSDVDVWNCGSFVMRDDNDCNSRDGVDLPSMVHQCTSYEKPKRKADVIPRDFLTQSCHESRQTRKYHLASKSHIGRRAVPVQTEALAKLIDVPLNYPARAAQIVGDNLDEHLDQILQEGVRMATVEPELQFISTAGHVNKRHSFSVTGSKVPLVGGNINKRHSFRLTNNEDPFIEEVVDNSDRPVFGRSMSQKNFNNRKNSQGSRNRAGQEKRKKLQAVPANLNESFQIFDQFRREHPDWGFSDEWNGLKSPSELFPKLESSKDSCEDGSNQKTSNYNDICIKDSFVARQHKASGKNSQENIQSITKASTFKSEDQPGNRNMQSVFGRSMSQKNIKQRPNSILSKSFHSPRQTENKKLVMVPANKSGLSPKNGLSISLHSPRQTKKFQMVPTNKSFLSPKPGSNLSKSVHNTSHAENKTLQMRHATSLHNFNPFVQHHVSSEHIHCGKSSQGREKVSKSISRPVMERSMSCVVDAFDERTDKAQSEHLINGNNDYRRRSFATFYGDVEYDKEDAIQTSTNETLPEDMNNSFEKFEKFLEQHRPKQRLRRRSRSQSRTRRSQHDEKRRSASLRRNKGRDSHEKFSNSGRVGEVEQEKEVDGTVERQESKPRSMRRLNLQRSVSESNRSRRKGLTRRSRLKHEVYDSLETFDKSIDKEEPNKSVNEASTNRGLSPPDQSRNSANRCGRRKSKSPSDHTRSKASRRRRNGGDNKASSLERKKKSSSLRARRSPSSSRDETTEVTKPQSFRTRRRSPSLNDETPECTKPQSFRTRRRPSLSDDSPSCIQPQSMRSVSTAFV